MAAAVPADLIAEAKANIEPRLRAANHFYTWMEIVVGDDSAAHNQIFYHLCPLFDLSIIYGIFIKKSANCNF